MADLGALRFGSGKKRLADLDDAELEDELRRRRAARSTGESLPERKRLAQLYASLELPFGASQDAVEAAYRRLREKYAPERWKRDPERHATAVELVDSLSRAYEGLVGALRDGIDKISKPER